MKEFYAVAICIAFILTSSVVVADWENESFGGTVTVEEQEKAYVDYFWLDGSWKTFEQVNNTDDVLIDSGIFVANIRDNNSDPTNYTLQVNGTEIAGQVTPDGDGTQSASIIRGTHVTLEYDTEYIWYVNVTDLAENGGSGEWSRYEIYFTTEEDSTPSYGNWESVSFGGTVTVEEEAPPSSGTWESVSFGGTVTVEEEAPPSSGTWESVSFGGMVTVTELSWSNWSDWWVMERDVADHSPEIWYNNPSNESVVDVNDKVLTTKVKDIDGDLMNISVTVSRGVNRTTWYNNTTTGTFIHRIDMFDGNGYETLRFGKYYWWVNVSSTDYTLSEQYEFAVWEEDFTFDTQDNNDQVGINGWFLVTVIVVFGLIILLCIVRIGGA